MKKYSISSKLLCITIVLFVLTITSLSSVMWLVLTTGNNQISASVSEEINIEVKERLIAKAQLYSEKVAAIVNEAYRVPDTFSAVMHQAGADGISRNEAEQLVAGVLAESGNLSSLYAIFEANGFDDHDADYVGGRSHSVPGSGNFEVYFVRDGEQIIQVEIKDAAHKYETAPDEFGVRIAEWYLCSKDTLKPCLMEPYLYEVTPGYSELMTSMSIPLLREGQFVGIVGADINLPVFQKYIDELAAKLYDGKARVTLLSQDHRIVASSIFRNTGRPLSEAADPSWLGQLSASGGEGLYLEENQTLTVVEPVFITNSGSYWSVVIDVDKQDALASSIRLQQGMRDNVEQTTSLLIVFGLISTLVAVLCIWLLTRSIVTPIQQLEGHMSQLASEEGDLTRVARVKSHSELMSLAGSFNEFLYKLKTLVFELKRLAGSTRSESEKAAQISQRIRENVTQQYAEIEDVLQAVSDMNSTSLDTAQASDHTAGEVVVMTENIKKSQNSLTTAMQYVETMSAESERAKVAVMKVTQSSENINSIVEVIRSIAEQTNLLALNAAIEAARAGDQGRGFAVVADEVRSLASKTQISTDNISKLIGTLHDEVSGASDVIARGTEHAGLAVGKTTEAMGSMEQIVAQIDDISGKVRDIAQAAEKQNSMTTEVNNNVSKISDSASMLASIADEAYVSSVNLSELVNEQELQLDKLKT